MARSRITETQILDADFLSEDEYNTRSTTMSGHLFDQILTTSGFLQDQINDVSSPDMSSYVLVDGTRGFTNTISGVNPTENYHLATKSYTDSVASDSSLIDHDQTINTHNLTTDIDHNQLTNTHQNVDTNGTPSFIALTVISGATINGNLTVSGTTFTTHHEIVEISDNLLLINEGEVGAGVSVPGGLAGIEVDRGTLVNYQFVFDEALDAFVIGEVEDLQPVATRQFSPTNSGISFWNSSEHRFVTLNDFKLSDGGLIIPNSGSIGISSGSLTLKIGGTAEQTITSTETTFGGNLVIPNSGYIGSVTTPTAMQITSTGNIEITSGLLFINETSNAFSTKGLTINQGDNTDEIFALKASYVTHPFTAWAENDTFLHIKNGSSVNGGPVIRGFSDGDFTGIYLQGYIGSSDPTDSVPAIKLVGRKSDGSTGVADLASSERVLQIDNNSTAIWHIAGNGDVVQTGNLTLPNSGYIGSATTPQAMQIKSNGEIVLPQKMLINSSPTNGRLLVGDNHSGGNLTTFGTYYSWGSPVIGYGVKPKSGGTGFVSSKIGTSPRSAILLTDGLQFLQASSQEVAIDSDITMTPVFTIESDGDVVLTQGLSLTGTKGIGVYTTVSTQYGLQILNNSLNINNFYVGKSSTITKTAGSTNYGHNMYSSYDSFTFNQSGGEIGHLYGGLVQSILTNGTVGNVGVTKNMYGQFVQALTNGGTVTGSILGTRNIVDLDSGTIGGSVFGRYDIIDIESSVTSIGGNVYGNYIDIDVDKDPTGTVYGLYISSASNVDYTIYTNGAVPSRIANILQLPDVYSHNMNGETMRDLMINDSGELGVDLSSERYKTNIKDISDTSWIYKLRPVDYEPRKRVKQEDGKEIYLDEGTGNIRQGLIAEEVEKVNPKYVYYDNEGRPDGVDYSGLIVPTLKEVQKLKIEIEQFKNIKEYLNVIKGD